MAKLKNIIENLSVKDFEAIYSSFLQHNADKSALLLKLLRENILTDTQIMNELGVSSNAYYTLRSRLNQRIEEYLLDQMETPRIDLIKKVANINEIILTKKRAIVIATLRKLEKELLNYDLSNELTIVYKALKKLHLHEPEYFTYSQLYNRHVAYMLATEKLESTVAEYFKKYGNYMLTESETEKLELSFLFKEILNISNLYQSHRLFVYRSCVEIMHRLFIEKELLEAQTFSPIEEVFLKIEQTFDTYYLDTQYRNFKLLFNYLKLQYYFHYKMYRKAEAYYESVNEHTELLLSNFGFYTFPSEFLFLKIQRSHRLEQTEMLYEEATQMFEDFTPYAADFPMVTYYYSYRALVAYFKGKYEESSQWIYELLNEVTFKNYPAALLEIKLLQALNYCILQYHDLFMQCVNSIQRQIRILGNCEHAEVFIKIMKTALSEKKSKDEKISLLVEKFKDTQKPLFCPIAQINMNEKFIKKMSNLL